VKGTCKSYSLFNFKFPINTHLAFNFALFTETGNKLNL